MLQVGFHKLFTEHIIATSVVRTKLDNFYKTSRKVLLSEKNRMLRYISLPCYCNGREM